MFNLKIQIMRNLREKFEICNLPIDEKNRFKQALKDRFGDMVKVNFRKSVRYRSGWLINKEGFTRAYISLVYGGPKHFNEISGSCYKDGKLITSSELERDYYSKGIVPSGYHIQAC